MKLKSLFIIIAAVIGIPAIYGYFKATPPVSGGQDSVPKIEITPESYDFGTIVFGTIAEYNFKVKNSGKETLEIKRVATSCGCTTAKVSQIKINPGETADLSVKYDTAAMGEGPHGTGKQDRIIYIKSNDPVNPQIEVTISAFVTPPTK